MVNLKYFLYYISESGKYFDITWLNLIHFSYFLSFVYDEFLREKLVHGNSFENISQTNQNDVF